MPGAQTDTHQYSAAACIDCNAEFIWTYNPVGNGGEEKLAFASNDTGNHLAMYMGPHSGNAPGATMMRRQTISTDEPFEVSGSVYSSAVTCGTIDASLTRLSVLTVCATTNPAPGRPRST